MCLVPTYILLLNNIKIIQNRFGFKYEIKKRKYKKYTYSKKL